MDEVKAVRSLGGEQTFLKLCGFKPQAGLRTDLHVRASHFLYPHEETVKGSRMVFAALLERCLARGVVAICQWKPRTTAEMSYVALLPQAEEPAEGGGQARPPGFHVLYLPFLDDLRQLARTGMEVEPPREAVAAAKEVIAKLKLRKFHPVENVALQSHYRMIEAHALKKVQPSFKLFNTLQTFRRR
jgi:ATP-dependent DNA helicase 2 subunit 1